MLDYYKKPISLKFIPDIRKSKYLICGKFLFEENISKFYS